MKSYPIKTFRRFAIGQDEGFMDFVLSLAVEVTPDRITLPDGAIAAIRKRFPRPEAYPNGLGTLARKGIDLASFGLAKPLADAIAGVMGKKECGCKGREACLNRLVPDVSEVSALGWVAVAVKVYRCLGAKEKTTSHPA